jgi:uncharacterized protein YcnI
MIRWKRPLVVGVVGAVGVLAGTCVASAHVGVSQDEVVAGEATTLTFTYSHGCGESPTNSLRFQVPAGVNNAVPSTRPGWDIEVEREELDAPMESAHGDPITDRPAIITFTAREGFEVPSGVKDAVSISFTAPEETGTLSFKVIQGCVEGSNDWIEEWDGTGAEPDHPAPSVEVVTAFATGDDAADDPTVPTSAPADDESTPSAAPADLAPVADSTDDDSNGLAIAGVILGVVGIGVGGFALLLARRRA